MFDHLDSLQKRVDKIDARILAWRLVQKPLSAIPLIAAVLWQRNRQFLSVSRISNPDNWTTVGTVLASLVAVTAATSVAGITNIRIFIVAFLSTVVVAYPTVV